jgi:hypothetical protein
MALDLPREASKSGLDEDHRFRLTIKLIEAGVTIARYLAWVAAVVVAGYYIRDIVRDLAGKQTDASLVVKMMLGLSADRWIAYAVGGVGTAFGLNERRLKRRDIKRLSRRTNDLESRLDRNRTSSELLPDGRTREDDR